MSRTYDVAVIGTGFAGVGMAVRLRAMNMRNFVVLEQADGLGGTWRDNHYPGAACDVPSHLYSFSFEPSPRWSRKYAGQPEILAYLNHVATKYGVIPHIRFGCCVTRAVWNPRRGVWTLSFSDGSAISAKVVIAGTGALSKPAEPEIAGKPNFRGPAFHTAAWNHDFDLDGKTVAVIGTGASAVQVVPALAPRVKALKLFQRTPPWILPKADRSIAELERKLFAQLPVTQRMLRELLYWQYETRVLAFCVKPELMWLPKQVALRYLRQQVPDAELRAKLTPNYAVGCKRVLMSDDYFQAVQHPSVEVITEPIVEIRAHSIATHDGSDRAVDAIVYATGFQVGDLAAPPFEIRGAEGVVLSQRWRSGPEAYLGTAVAGFPNLFFIIGPNSLLGHNSMVHMIEGHIQYIASCLETMQLQGLATVQVRQQVQERFNRWVQKRMQRTIWATGGCRNRYQTSAGKHVAIWPGSTFDFRNRTARFDLQNYEVTRCGASSKEEKAWQVHP
jgi:cation diffusion facilitator CzcD-associated flavoprotein CzcO